MPTDVDGTFVAVGGAGLIPFLKAYEQAKGPIDAKKFIGNLFWGTPGQFEQLGPRVAGAYIGGAGTAGDLDTPAAQDYATNIIGKWFKIDPARWDAAPQAAPSTFTYGYYAQHVGPHQGPRGRQGRHLRPEQAPGGAGQGRSCRPRTATVKLDDEPPGHLHGLRPAAVHEERQAGGQDRVGQIPDVDQTFGGTFSALDARLRDATSPGCEKKTCRGSASPRR